MFSPVPTNDPLAVQAEVQAIYSDLFPSGNLVFVPTVFGWATDCFTGRYQGYQEVDAMYHDFEHTLQGTLCMARLLRGRQRAGATPQLPQRVFELGILAILLHDTGYLKRLDDTEGTGAKYTIIHVSRSADFAAELLGAKGFSEHDIKAVQHMILCTGVNTVLSAIPFQDHTERIAGYALATADLLGQMAADDYIAKLPELYEEFAEATHFSHDEKSFVAGFRSPNDLIRKTPAFWTNVVLVKLEQDFLGLYRFLNDPYPSGPNFYLDKIEANMAALRRMLSEQPASS